MSRACGVAAWQGLATAAGRASEAERLELEAHLSSCARCADDQAMFGLVRRLREADDDLLGAAAHDRIRRAMRGHVPRSAPASRAKPWPVALGAALALAAAVVLIQRQAARVAEPTALSVVAGDVAVSEEPAGVSVLRSNLGGRVRVGDVVADLSPATEVRWDQRGRELTLRRGRLTVDRPPGAQGSVRVATAHFFVELASARFTMDGANVRAERGSVRVVGPEGAPLELGEGRSWSSSVEARVAPSPAAPAVAPPSAGAPAATARARVAPSDDAAEGLARAHRALGRGDAAGARASLEPLFRRERSVAAEARVLHAESFLIEGRYADAIEAYRVVARDFGGTGQAESALYAAAQLESEHGRSSDAIAAFRRYLDRYPTGRFVREASERIARLSATP